MYSLTLPADAASVMRARSFVEELASDHLGDPFPAVLMTSELVGNVVRHAHTELTVTVKPGPPFRVEVHDGVAATDAFRALIAQRPSPPAMAASGGRGLGLLHDLATRIGLDDDPPNGGKVVWFEM